MSASHALPPPDEYQGDRLMATAISFLILNAIFVGLRIWSRRLQGPKWRNDDVFVLLGLLVITGTCITSICAVQLGRVGYHIQHVPKAQRIQWLKTTYLTAPCLYITSASLPKLAIVCMYLKIFNDKWSRGCTYVVAFVLAVGPVITVPVLVAQCQPVAYLWDKTIKGGRCNNQAHMFRYGSIPNIVTDVVMLLLPMPTVWKLHTSMKVKIGLFVTFLLGSVGLITSVLRFVAFFIPIADGTWAAVPLLMWVIIEPSIYLVASCLLAYKPLLKHLVTETSLSRVFSITRSWTTRKSGQRSDGSTRERRTVYRLPSEDGDFSDKRILRAREFTVEEGSQRSSDQYAMGPVAAPTESQSRIVGH